MLRVFFIKDLKALENGTTRFSIDIKVLKDLRWHLDDRARGGQAPALRAAKILLLTVGLGPSDATRASERVSLASCVLWKNRLLFSSGP